MNNVMEQKHRTFLTNVTKQSRSDTHTVML